MYRVIYIYIFSYFHSIRLTWVEFRNRLGWKRNIVSNEYLKHHLTLVIGLFPMDFCWKAGRCLSLFFSMDSGWNTTQPTPRKRWGEVPNCLSLQRSQQNMAKYPLPPTWKWNHVKKIPYFHKPESSQWLNPPTPLKNMRKSKWVHLPPCVGVKIPKICVKQTSTQRIFPWTHAFFSGWWFQPLWKILVKLEIFPK